MMRFRLALAVAAGALFVGPAVADDLELTVKQITSGPKNHFFGYIGHVQNIPWNASGRYILALRTSFQDRMPGPDDPADIVLIDTAQRNAVRVLTQTRAWNPQQGTMLYWNPTAAETQFFFNDRDPRTGHVFCVLYDISAGSHGSRVREYRFADTPVGNSGVAQRGKSFLAINYARMARLRPVTGYRGAHDWTVGVKHPADDGIFHVDIESGAKRLLVSFERIASALQTALSDVDVGALFINHTLWNREGDRVFFFARAGWDGDPTAKKVNQAFTIWPDGTHLKPLRTHIGGHPEWDFGRRLIGALDGRQVVYDVDRDLVVGRLGTAEIFPNPEGDIALSPDGHWFVNGYKDRGTRNNFFSVFRRQDGAFVRSAGLSIGTFASGDLRQDPSPCWNRDGTKILVPGLTPDGKSRQLFVLEVSRRKNP